MVQKTIEERLDDLDKGKVEIKQMLQTLLQHFNV